MGYSSHRLKKRKKALEELHDLVREPSNLLLVHYSCESFYDITDGRTPRITSIAIRHFNTGQTISFSIHKVAEKKGMLTDIDAHYDALEKQMLDEFYDFVSKHETYNWIHWNMRDINFGFLAIEHRYSVLDGTPISIHDKNKYDLARKLMDIYGVYVRTHPRFEKLADKNHIGKMDFLKGEDEAAAFSNHEYVKLHRSTLRKVDMMNSIIEKVIDGTLKTDSGIIEIYGLTPSGMFELLKDHWLFHLIFFILSCIGSGLIGYWVTKIFN